MDTWNNGGGCEDDYSMTLQWDVVDMGSEDSDRTQEEEDENRKDDEEFSLLLQKKQHLHHGSSWCILLELSCWLPSSSSSSWVVLACLEKQGWVVNELQTLSRRLLLAFGKRSQKERERQNKIGNECVAVVLLCTTIGNKLVGGLVGG